MGRFSRVLLDLLMLVMMGTSAWAAPQTAPSHTIRSSVDDTTGSAIAGAQITLRDAAGAAKGTTTSDADGHFVISSVAPGKYVLVTESPSFETSRTDVVISPAAVPETELHITMRVAGVHQTVTVTESGSYAVPDAIAGTKVELPLMETPVAVQVIPHQVLQDQQTINLVDALVNVSGVAPTNDSYGTSDSFSIRGFDANDLLYLDGMKLDQYSASGFPLDMANVEEIQAVKGPASVLYGQSEPGGLVEVVTKKPQSNRFASLDQQFGNHQFFRTTADLDKPLVKDKLLFRFVLDGTDANSFRDFVHTNEFNIYPSLTWRPSKVVDLTLQTAYETGSNILDMAFPSSATAQARRQQVIHGWHRWRSAAISWTTEPTSRTSANTLSSPP